MAGRRYVDFEHGLNTAINRVREALGDSAAKPRFVETIPRRGYRFIAAAEFAEAAPPGYHLDGASFTSRKLVFPAGSIRRCMQFAAPFAQPERGF
jgi:DNA-binding winged helix-turn-helix (wHTH) protein